MLVLFFAFLGVAWNLLGGYAGQFSFGHAAFFGIGAYTSTLLLVRLGVSPWLGILAGGALAAAFGCFAGYLAFRYGLRGPYFALVTLAFAEMLRLVALNWTASEGPWASSSRCLGPATRCRASSSRTSCRTTT